jgi:ParB-like chromosome segregation protein Spo0J
MNALPKAFQHFIVSIPLGRIIPQTSISAEVRTGAAFRQIAASVKEIGLIEPLVVFQQSKAEYLLLDGHLRLDVLKEAGAKEARCILATDDESYTYNRRVNTIPPIAQHLMLLEALRNGLSEERIAKSLNVDVSVIRRKRDMLNGICAEAVEMLKDFKLNANVFTVMRKMKALRQIEVAEHMIANSAFSLTFAQALLFGTKPEMLLVKPRLRDGKSAAEAASSRFSEESDALLKDLRGLEDSFGKDALTLTVCQRYVERLLKNAKVVRYLERRHDRSLGALQLWLEKRQLSA